jgi:hypothetical protein
MLGVHPIELRLTQSTKQVVDRLIVGIESVPRSWSEEVHRLDIACVDRDIPKDLTLSTEERTHPLTPHLVVLAIEVWSVDAKSALNANHTASRKKLASHAQNK